MRKFFVAFTILAVLVVAPVMKASSQDILTVDGEKTFIPLTVGTYFWATVVNCNEWISLRERPTVYSDALAHIPLGATVKIYFGVLRDTDSPKNGFYWTEYNGMKGCCLEEYLQRGQNAGSVP